MKHKDESHIWGTPDYMKARYMDMSTVRKVSKHDGMYLLLKEIVDEIKSPKNNMYVYGVYRTNGRYAGKRVSGYVGRIVVGLNGNGNQADYLRALTKLVSCRDVRINIFDAFVDECDDLADVLVSFSQNAPQAV